VKVIAVRLLVWLLTIARLGNLMIMSESGTDLSHIAADHAIAFVDMLPGPDLAHRRLVAYSKWVERHPARASPKRA
jgi:hypothetical protein